MESSSYIVEAGPENFRPLVLGNSRIGPVLVFYWSPNAGPCLRLLPRLVKLANELGGRFLLALLDADEQKAFAHQQGVVSIPTVRVYFREQLAETVRGTCSGQLFRGVLEKYLPKPVIAARQQAAARAIELDDIEQAITHLQTGLAEQPDNARLALDLAKLLLRNRRHSEAAAVMDALPARCGADPDDYAGHYQPAARQLLDYEFGEALATLHGIRQNANAPLRNRAKHGMFAVLALLGPEHALAGKFQALLTQ